MGDHEQAKQHALSAYRRAWADGEPYVQRHALGEATAVLEQLGVPIPRSPVYDPYKDMRLPWEATIIAVIDRFC